MKSFNNMIREIYETQLTFICYLRKKLIDAGFIKADLLWTCGLDEKLHCSVGLDQNESPFEHTANISIDSLEHISLNCPVKDFSIKFHLVNSVVYADSTNLGKMEKDKCDIILRFIRDIVDKWCDYQSLYCRVMDDKTCGLYTPDHVWNKMKSIDEPYDESDK
jgi:hypothetical protein